MGQPACLEEQQLQLSLESIYLANQIVESRTCHNAGRALVPIKILTFTLAQALALALTISSIVKLCHQLIKTYTATVKLLKQNQTLGAGLCKKPLKAQYLNLYYKNSHLDCYRFCQQCKDYFETAGANRPNCISFATSFLFKVVVQ